VPTNDDVTEAVAENLAAPRRFRSEACETEQHDLAGQVKAAEFLMRKRAADGSPFDCLRSTKVEFPGGSG
jgi:hypothetical protein